jgi:tripartite-type tricarboxylate transporter receptor subunit TctC
MGEDVRILPITLGAAAWLLVPVFGYAQYPAKPVRLIIPFVAGGAPDFIARAIEPRLSEGLGQRVFVDNRPGAGGTLAGELAARAPADGYTLILGGVSIFAIAPALHGSKLRYDPVNDFAHVSLIARSPVILVAHPSLPARTLMDLIALAKRRPGQLNYASSGTGTPNHLIGELFGMQAGIDIRHVPYKGGPPALVGLVGGEVSLHMGQIPPVAPFLKAGRVRALAVSGVARSAALPDVPTFTEAGTPGLDATSWSSLAAPAGTSNEIVQVLNREIVRVLGLADVRQRLAGEGQEVAHSSPGELVAFLRSEIARWSKAVKASGATVD